MNNTTELLQPPSSNNSRQEMSYLFGRDPSILAYGQRPIPSKDTKRNLLSVYEVEESACLEDNSILSTESHTFQTIKVYLRLKPFPKKLKVSQEEQDAYKITNATTLFTRLPVLDNNTSSLKRASSNDVVCRKFIFTKTFGPETTQLELFEQAIKQQMIDFLAGQNCTIMTYGTTNSGKSYTLQGTTTSPGIIPRGLEFVFSNIVPKSTPSYKPVHHCDVVSLDPIERAQELEIKTKLLTIAPVDKYQYVNAYKEMQKLLQDESPIRPSQCNDAHYSVWVSFAEIYNETVYDLLSNECQKKRTPLKLATDNHGRAFIKGLKTVCVNSGSEAYQVLMAGQYNLKVAATALNARSSRSHCIFTIKLLKYYMENLPDSVEISTFSFCDLAGSERLKKTLNIGDRLKEAQNINTSLLVLGRCLKSIHEGQLAKQKGEHVGPFRESKLTRLFQKALSGKEQMALIVNINPLPNLYVETQNVLSFSAIAKKIVIEDKEKTKNKVKSRFSQLVTQSIKSVTDWDATELESEEWQHTDKEDASDYIHPDDYENLLYENKKLKKEIVNLKNSALARDLEIRQEMAKTYSAMMKDLESDWKNRIKDVEEQQENVLAWSVKKVEDFYKEKLDQLSSRKRRRSCTGDDIDDSFKNIEDLELENSRLTSKVVSLKNIVRELKDSNQNLKVEKNKIHFELSLTKEHLKTVEELLKAAEQDISYDEESEHYVNELKSQLSGKQEQVKKLKIYLNEAKEEYIAITTEMREKEGLLKEQEEIIVENEDKIDELEDHLEQVNICLTEKTKTVEILEEKLSNQGKQIFEAEDKMEDMMNQIEKLTIKKQSLLDQLNLLQVCDAAEDKDAECIEKTLDEIKSPTEDTLNDKIIVNEHSSSPKTEKLHEDSREISYKETQTECVSEVNSENENVIAVRIENEALKEKLVQSKIEIESLKVELESMKDNLKTISDQIDTFKAKEECSNINLRETEEVSCQTDIQCEKELKQNECDPTDEKHTNEGTTQTSFIAEFADEELEQYKDLTAKYNNLQEEYNIKCSRVEELSQEISSFEQQIKVLSEKNNVNEVVIEEYKQSVELLQSELANTKKDKENAEDLLHLSTLDLKKQVVDYEQRLVVAQAELSSAKNNNDECMERLKTAQEDLRGLISKCKVEHEERINELQKELSISQEKNSIKEQCLDVHTAKIAELEHVAENARELKEQIHHLNEKLDLCQVEKERLQKLLDENNDKILELQDCLDQAADKEREKETEIATLQSEMKRIIQLNESDEKTNDIMEKEMKNTIQNLTQLKELLSQREERINHLEQQLKGYEQNAKVLDLLQQSAQERQAENQRLRDVNEELKSSLIEKEREMESFMKHRDEMVTKYESLVKSQQEELERQKKQLMKSDSNRKDKDYHMNSSEDETVVKERRGRRPGRKPASKNQIAVIDLCASDSKQAGKQADLLPPNVETASEKKRNVRKKKLYLATDESFQDIEPLESTITITPSSQTRTLRSRRK